LIPGHDSPERFLLHESTHDGEIQKFHSTATPLQRFCGLFCKGPVLIHVGLDPSLPIKQYNNDKNKMKY
jgi:hypothetical protein